ncbi:putative F-box domain, RNA ligase/cyclic nucleotide phosphodiesterase [Rosa chinensis]|uniref:Putative F-box domain, RNA ligase/cyclic nucleotide phosphodiesterase n=1 Tax=Rosa chinensis TaxID=74649 RepID=A0A2P6RQ56_ROSCH|nr:putative F-box protein At3g17480 [Rosa chinensis]XP_024184905.1 putative F-box protein At3g17480 [Rosa chinensis]XP_024184907.1 putative F-box protein At3g17480 [Rosa chinensis]PRQ48521.1 putative F-box domain, RNA ligase/cyclic nucleotide phosphodiesterase [Rosa chinensis]
MAEVDEDLVEKILSTLPPKALMRFKCASKGWYALINDPRFVANHLSYYNSNSKRLLLMKKRLVSKDNKDTANETAEEEEEELVFSLLNLCNNDDDIDNGEDSIIVSSVEDIKIPFCMSLKTRGEAVHIVGHCNGIICLLLVKSFQVLLWNPAIQEFKLLPPFPYLPDDDWYEDVWSRYVQGFGYDPKLNEYKVVNIGLVSPSEMRDDGYDIYNPPKAAIYTLSTDSWRKINTNAFETETTVLRPESFQIQFKQIFYWLGHEQHKELIAFDRYEDLTGPVIILLDIENEVFHDIMLPECLYHPWVFTDGMELRVWNESPALFVLVVGLQGYKPEDEYSFVIWVLDELGGPKGAWTKHLTLDPTEKPLAFLNSNEIFINDFMKLVLSYDLGSESLKDFLIQNTPYSTRQICDESDDIVAVVYVKSIVSVLGAHKLESRNNSSAVNFSPLTHFPSGPSIVDRELHSYSIWAIPPNDVSFRIKKLMEGLRAEFGGPEIKPHITVVGSIRMTYEDVLNKFRSLPSKYFRAYQAKVNLVVTSNFYHQCVSLLIDSSTEVSHQLDCTTRICTAHWGFHSGGRPYLSLLYGNLTEEERKIALEKVSSLDKNISSLSFTISQLAVYKIDYRDITLKSWEKIAEYALPFH